MEQKKQRALEFLNSHLTYTLKHCEHWGNKCENAAKKGDIEEMKRYLSLLTEYNEKAKDVIFMIECVKKQQ